MKPSIPKGTRDFSPQEMVRRNYIFDTIKQVFQRYGYLPIETPAMENLSTLMGKYGEEGDKLIFKILNSGDYFKDIPSGNYLEKIGFDVEEFATFFENWRKTKEGEMPMSKLLNAKALLPHISEKALRYDLTVPFARYVVQHQSEITFPFKRYQIQPVWRADKPQKGRYREFYQCDADVIGSNSLINEVELVQMVDEVFTIFKIKVVIKINNRKILQGLGIFIGEENRIVDITVALDKYDKIGEKIYDELKEKEFSENSILKLKSFVDEFRPLKDIDKVSYLKAKFKDIPLGLLGIAEVLAITERLRELNGIFGKPEYSTVELDLTLARGLNYYTGAIFEVQVNDSRSQFTSSICGGGRYDDLTGIFGLPNVSGVGISFGADRIYDVLNELNLYPDNVSASTRVLFVAFGEKEQNDLLPLLAKVRKAGVNSEIYPNFKADPKKQYSYGESKGVPFVISIKDGILTLKNTITREREELTIEKIIEKLK